MVKKLFALLFTCGYAVMFAFSLINLFLFFLFVIFPYILDKTPILLDAVWNDSILRYIVSTGPVLAFVWLISIVAGIGCYLVRGLRLIYLAFMKTDFSFLSLKPRKPKEVENETSL